MSGSPPPSYNPNDSLLSGGDTAKIIPVQGGGSMLSPNYNADASLLSGGESAKIIPVQGGGQNSTISNLSNNNNDSKEDDDDDTLQLDEEEGENTNVNNEDINNNSGSTLTNTATIGENEETDLETDLENDDLSEVNENDDSSVNAADEEEKTKEIPCAEPDSKELEDIEDAFEGSEEAVDVKLKETIRLHSQEFVLRKPKAKRPGQEQKDDVMNDWTSGVFTDQEADFLNLLGFSPKLLYTSFSCLDRDWQEELANFLYYLTVMTCYPARLVITKSECQHVREFLMIVESNMKAQKLRKLAEKPIPVVGPIDLPGLGTEEEEEEGEGEEGENKGNNENSHQSILDRLKGISVEGSKEVKTFTRKVKNFLAKLKFPSLFKKMKEDQENGEFPENVNENERVDNEGQVVAVVSSGPSEPVKTKEELEREYAEQLRELEIKKAMERLPKEYQTETYRQYINRELRKHGFDEGNLNAE